MKKCVYIKTLDEYRKLRESRKPIFGSFGYIKVSPFDGNTLIDPQQLYYWVDVDAPDQFTCAEAMDYLLRDKGQLATRVDPQGKETSSGFYFDFKVLALYDHYTGKPLVITPELWKQTFIIRDKFGFFITNRNEEK